DLAVRAIDLDTRRARDALGGDLAQLCLERRRRERLAPQPPAVDRAAADREIHAWIVEARKNVLLDVVERHHPPRHAVLQALEGARNLPDASRGILLRP